MRYKITWGKDDRRDRWGHFISSTPQHTEYASSNTEAEIKALEISKVHKKMEVLVYDLEGPELGESTCWLIKAYKAGARLMENHEYTMALHNKHLGLSY